MTVRLLEAVPNFSEGRDLAVVRAIVEAMRRAGADVLDWSADPDHHRSVVTIIGSPEIVEAAAVEGTRVAVDRIDLRRHRGVHPRVGAADVLPFVPLVGLTLEAAAASARRVGARLAGELGVPVYYYAEAARPAGRRLAEARRGGYESLVEGWPPGREPDELPIGWSHPGAHPRAGVSCVGARQPLLAWNVFVEGITLEQAEAIATGIRERDGRNRGVRALALALESRDALQISMNMEDPVATPPTAVYGEIERALEGMGGRVAETEIIGLAPDSLYASAAAERLRLRESGPRQLLSARVLAHLGARSGEEERAGG
jgi:glutamate formiminotransferase